jgi:hypothetical protein
MSDSAPPSDSPARGPFQFGLATLLIVVVGLSILLSLVTWEPNRGTALGILATGSLWTAAAIRSGRRRLAYHLASVPMGVMGYAVLSLPISPVTAVILSGVDFDPGSEWPCWQPMLVMCLATLAGAATLRRVIRKRGRRNSVAAGVHATYVTAMFFPAALVVLMIPWEPEALLWGVLLVFLGVFGSAGVATLSLYVALPTAILFCVVLRWIDPPERDLSEREWEILEAVETLAAGAGAPISCGQIAERVGCTAEDATRQLNRLFRLGLVRRTAAGVAPDGPLVAPVSTSEAMRRNGRSACESRR